MQTVQTLHHGFLEEPDPAERRVKRHPSSDKHSKIPDAGKFIPERRIRDPPRRYAASDLEMKHTDEVVAEAESVDIPEWITPGVEDRNVGDVAISRKSSKEWHASEVGSINRGSRGNEENLNEGKIYEL